MAWDDNQVALLRAADDGRVRHRVIHSNSGPGTSRWFVGDTVASAAEALELHEMYAAGLLLQTPGGHVTPSARGRTRLLLSEQP